jgi:hypothetical protein
MNKIFFHIAKIGGYKYICDDIFSYIIESNILNDSELYLSIVGSGELDISLEHNILYENNDIKNGEFPILSIIRDMSINSNENFNVLYLHTKGVSTPYNECVNDWRKYMSYFNIIKYKDCIKILENYDTCGVDLREYPVLHYSGNFWWANSSYIKKLPLFKDMDVVLSERHKAEFWVCNMNGKHYSMHDCGINQYERHLHRYEEKKYK